MEYQEGRNFEILNEEDSWRVVWIKDGKHHCETGPAIIYAHGTQYWYLFGEKITEAEFNIFLTKKDLYKKLQENLIDKNEEKRTKI